MHKIYRFNEDREGFGNKLKELMVANGYTIESLSSDLDENVLTSINTIKKWRSGERIPDIDTIHKLAKKFNVSMQELYMPNSVYDNPLSEEMSELLGRRITIKQLTQNGIEELKMYSEFLFQKLLFSFLSFKERGHLNGIYYCYELTPYGKDKLGIEDDLSFVNFYQKVKEYIKREYGESLPYKIDYKQSKSIYKDFGKMIILAEKGND